MREYIVRVEDRTGDRWSFTTHTVQEAVEIAAAQRVEIVWIKRREEESQHSVKA